MIKPRYPSLDPQSIAVTRDALHAYARVLGEWTSSCRSKRKHWWHASLRPSLNGLATGVVHAGVDFELELNLRDSRLHGRTSNGDQLTETLQGQPVSKLAAVVREFLLAAGVGKQFIPDGHRSADGFAGYSPEHALSLSCAISSVSAAMESFRAGIREETSPIQVWPHHFDLAMLWLPGAKVPGQDSADEEHADQQMNFGFTFGDEGIPEPYFYITAYPLPEAFPNLELPAGTTWHADGFNGVVLPYASLIENADPHGYLLDLWNRLLVAGSKHMTAAAI